MPDSPTAAVMPLGKVKSKPLEISRDNPMTAWLSLMASPAATRTGLSPLELDGYLTGVIVAPQAAPISPSRWMANLWEDAEPVFDDAQVGLVARALLDRHCALVLDIERGLERLRVDRICHYRPMFMPSDGKPTHETVRRWAKGFWRAAALALDAWGALANDDKANFLLEPFVDFFDPDDQGLIDIPDDAVLDESAAAIPRAILALHALATMYSRSNPPPKTGRNDPCPCGSGEKFKRCCGRS
jgi:uncharacterized protein